MEFPARLFLYGFLLTIVILSQTTYGLPINTEEREKLSDILTRLDRTLNDLHTWLATEKKQDVVQKVQQRNTFDDGSEYNSQDNEGNGQGAPFINKEPATTKAKRKLASLEDLLRYLLKLKSQGKNTQANKRDFDVPFPISS